MKGLLTSIVGSVASGLCFSQGFDVS